MKRKSTDYVCFLKGLFADLGGLLVSFSLLVLVESFWRLNKVGVSKSHYPIFHPQITQIIQIFFKYNMYNNLRHQRHLRMKYVFRRTPEYLLKLTHIRS